MISIVSLSDEMRKSILYSIPVFCILLLSTFSCKKDNLPFTENHLNFSADTVLFDTIFTTVGSTTKRFKIYNRNNVLHIC